MSVHNTVYLHQIGKHLSPAELNLQLPPNI